MHKSRSRSPISRTYSSEQSRCLRIHNLPREWEFDKIKDFIRSQASDKMVMECLRFVEVSKDRKESIARFNNPIAAQLALRDLNGMSIGYRKLVVTLCDLIPQSRESDKYNNQQNSDQNLETYGLNYNFLNDIGVKPPLVNRIFVNNLSAQVTKDKLYEVFSMAGKITNLIFINKGESTGYSKLSAKIEYDHPVEAVQAVSMFHNQELYDKRILTRLDYYTTGPLNTPIPAGLKTVGPGLGCDGEPMTNVRLHMEIQRLKQELSNNPTSDDANTASYSNQTDSGSNINRVMPYSQQNNTFPINPLSQNGSGSNRMPIWASLINNPLTLAMQAQSGTINQNTDWKSMTQAVVQQANNGMQANLALMSHQTMANHGNMEKQAQKRSFDDRDNVYSKSNMDVQDKRNYKEEDDNMGDMVVFTHLPSSVSTHALKCKMAEMGDVNLVAMTGEGRAIVRFRNRNDSELCIKMFNKSRVDGQIINVNYF